MDFLEKLIQKAKRNRKVICLPESEDRRILEAAEKIVEFDFADIVLIGDEEEILKSGYRLEGVKIIDPKLSELTDVLISSFYELRASKGITMESAKELLLSNSMYYACMLEKCGYVDGIVSGANHSTADTLKPALQIIKNKKDISLVSAFFLMDVKGKGVYLFGDSGLVQDPTSEELADIAGTSASSFESLVGERARVAMLSHSTMGSAKHPLVTKVVEATKIAKEKYPTFAIDGELQLDAAIVPEVAKSKAPESSVAGQANVLIFPNLDAGNIGYKLVERLAGAKAYGPITQGMQMPVNDLSRGCSVMDIVGVVAITAIQAEGNK